MRKPPRRGQVLGHRGAAGPQRPELPGGWKVLGKGACQTPEAKRVLHEHQVPSEIKIVSRPAQRRTVRPASERVRTLLGHLPPRHKSVAPLQRGRSARWSEDPRRGGRQDGQKVSPRLRVPRALPCHPEGGGDPAARAPQCSPHGTGPETASLTARPQHGLPSANPRPRHRAPRPGPGHVHHPVCLSWAGLGTVSPTSRRTCSLRSDQNPTSLRTSRMQRG